MSTLRAFIIEDDDDLAVLFEEAVIAAGYQTEIIKDGGEASKRLKTDLPDLVVLDLHLPEITGQDLLEQIHTDNRDHLPQIIIASADAALARWLNDKVDLVLLKPITYSQLRDMAQRLKHHKTRL